MTNKNEKLIKLFSSIELDYKNVIQNGTEIKYKNKKLTSIFREILSKIHPNRYKPENKIKATSNFQNTSSIIDNIKKIYGIT